MLTKNRDLAKAAAKRYRRQSDNPPGVDETELSDKVRRLAREIDAQQERMSSLQREHGYYEAAKSLLHRIPSQVAKHDGLEGRLAEVVRCLAQRRQELEADGYREEEHVLLNADLHEAENKWTAASAQAQEKRDERDLLHREFWRISQNAMDESAEAVNPPYSRMAGRRGDVRRQVL